MTARASSAEDRAAVSQQDEQRWLGARVEWADAYATPTGRHEIRPRVGQVYEVTAGEWFGEPTLFLRIVRDDGFLAIRPDHQVRLRPAEAGS